MVRDRLEDDFAGGKVFKARDLLPESAVSSGLGNFDLTTLGSGKDGGWSEPFQRQRGAGKYPSILSQQ